MGFHINHKHRQLGQSTYRYNYSLYLKYRKRIKKLQLPQRVKNSLARILLTIFWRRRSSYRQGLTQSQNYNLQLIRQSLVEFADNQYQLLSKFARQLLIILTDSLISYTGQYPGQNLFNINGTIYGMHHHFTRVAHFMRLFS